MSASSTFPRPDLRRIGEQALSEVLDTLLSLSLNEATPAASAGDGSKADYLVGTVDLVGDRLSGDVRLQLPEAFARLAARRLVGGHAAAEPLADANAADLAGELCNMVAGRVAARLRRDGYPAELSPPRVVRAPRDPRDPSEPARGDERRRTCWLCEGHLITLEIQCRHQPP